MIYLLLFAQFFKIGLFTFGGGFAMIPLIEETVLKYNWLNEGEFYSFLGVCESTPGPVAINMATYIGSAQGGILGSIMATLGVVLPSFIIILIIAAILKNLTENKFFKGFIKGVKPVIVSLILSTGLVLLAKAIGYISIKEFSFEFVPFIIFALICSIFYGYKWITKKNMSTIVLILISAALGILCNVVKEFIV